MPWQDKVSTAVQFLKEVRLELKKVTWPKRDEVVRATVLTLVATVVISVYLGFTDFVLQNGIRPLFVGTVGFWTFVMVAYFGALLYLVYITTKE